MAQQKNGQDRKDHCLDDAKKPGDGWRKGVFAERCAENEGQKRAEGLQENDIENKPDPDQRPIRPGPDVKDKAKKTGKCDLPQQFVPEQPLGMVW